ncbi:unnamed protein product [Trichogramma brassicae]|uniref:Uncharacterized protein n=1 Tax=Trichogramma brassicae TaxID=86971 RepID=A0A6H5I4S2_9HYME|nr:unnamed protein product [Trichogramma brassicae]
MTWDPTRMGLTCQICRYQSERFMNIPPLHHAAPDPNPPHHLPRPAGPTQKHRQPRTPHPLHYATTNTTPQPLPPRLRIHPTTITNKKSPTTTPHPIHDLVTHYRPLLPTTSHQGHNHSTAPGNCPIHSLHKGILRLAQVDLVGLAGHRLSRNGLVNESENI